MFMRRGRTVKNEKIEFHNPRKKGASGTFLKNLIEK